MQKVCFRDINIHLHIYTRIIIYWRENVVRTQLRLQGSAFGSAHTIDVKMDHSIQTHSQGLVWIIIIIISFLFGEFWSVHFLCRDVTLSCAFNPIALPGCSSVPFFCYTDLRNPQNNLEVFLVVLPQCLRKTTHYKTLIKSGFVEWHWIYSGWNSDFVSIPTEWGGSTWRYRNFWTLSPIMQQWLLAFFLNMADHFLPCHVCKSCPTLLSSFQWAKILIHFLLLMSWLSSCSLTSCCVTTWKGLENENALSAFQHCLTHTRWLHLLLYTIKSCRFILSIAVYNNVAWTVAPVVTWKIISRFILML